MLRSGAHGPPLNQSKPNSSYMALAKFHPNYRRAIVRLIGVEYDQSDNRPIYTIKKIVGLPTIWMKFDQAQ